MAIKEPRDGPNIRRLYNDLAWIWPLISPPEDYVGEAEEFHNLIQAFSSGAANQILHLGCGAGHLDYHLKTHYQLTGVDLSLPMLAQANALNPTLSYLQGDMRTLRLAAKFDAVILADASDYLLSLEDLETTARTAFHHLRRGGVFCTYAEEIRERFVQNKTHTIHRALDAFAITVIENIFDPDPQDSNYEMTFIYLIRQAGVLSIEVDRHIAGLFSSAEWINSLEEAGFQVEMIEYDSAGPGFIGQKV
jgi:predicted TPR repeat methyltransferase